MVIHEYRTDSEYFAIRAPTDGSSLGNGTVLILTTFSTTPASISAWGWNLSIPAGKVVDKSLAIQNRASDFKVFFHGNESPILHLSYLIVNETTAPYDPNYEAQQKENEQKDKEQKDKIKELENPPGTSLWDPFFWTVFALTIVIISALAAWYFTRTILLVGWLHSGNVFVIAVSIFLTLLNFTWMVWNSDGTLIGQMVAFAMMALRQVIIVGALLGWFLGVGFARKTLDILCFWVANVHTKEIDEIIGVRYIHRAETMFADQTWSSALDRLVRNMHKKIVYASDYVARQSWRMNGFPSFEFAFINDFVEEDDMVVIDAKGQNVVSAIMKDSSGKRTKISLETDHSNIARALGCTLETTSHAEWEVHCRHEDILIKDLDSTIDRNRFLEQQLLLTRNREVKKYITILNNNVLDLSYGKSKSAEKQDLIEEARKAIEANQKIASKTDQEDSSG